MLPSPKVYFTPATIYLTPGSSILLNPVTINASKFIWLPTAYLNNPYTQYPNCTPQQEVNYQLQAISDSGCVGSNYVKVIVETPIKIPNVFSPNGDKKNDTWQIENLYTHSKAAVQIYDRYGRLLYQCLPGNYQPWNGKYNGADVPVGTYYYIIKLTPASNPIAGALTILR